MNVSPSIKNQTLYIAKGHSPVDTGNLKYNAIRRRNSRPNSWSITYSTSDAYYVEILEDGTLDGKEVKGRVPRKFIARTSLEIASFLTRYYEGKPVSRWRKDNSIASQDTPERRLRNFESQYRLGNVKWR